VTQRTFTHVENGRYTVVDAISGLLFVRADADIQGVTVLLKSLPPA
jgi:hypothetical protein